MTDELTAMPAEETNPSKTPWPLRLLGILCLLAGVGLVTNTGFISYDIVAAILAGKLASYSIITRITVALFGVLALAIVILLVFLGIRLLRNNRRRARLIAEALIALTIIALMCLVMLYGMKGYLIVPGILLIAEIALLSYIDPALADERELQRKLRKMETRAEVEEGTLGLDATGKGFIRLDFFNIFWIFVVCCILGIVVEVAYHMIVVEPGVYQNRTGMLWGQFSPIYGFGAVLMTIALNRFHDRSLIVIFLVSAIIGGAFEFFVSWFMEVAFGVTAWDYTGTFMSIGGRTNFMFMCMWGTLGVVWIRFCLPRMLTLVNMIPWKWRYSITAIAAAFMIFNGVMTLISLDCWAERLAGVEPDNAIARYCAEHYDNEWMEDRFQSMTINPEGTARV